MQNFINGLFSWIGFTVIAWCLIMYFLYKKFPKISIEIQRPSTFNESDNEEIVKVVDGNESTEHFAVDLNAYKTNLPTVYSKNCAFTGIKPKGYIPNITDWQKYTGFLP